MSATSTRALGWTAATVLAVAGFGVLASGRRSRASMGREPVRQNLDRFFVQDCSVGTIYQPKRGDIVLGRGEKSITWRALRSAAALAGVDDPEKMADDASLRVQYAALVCAAPPNADALCDDPGRGYRRPSDGRGIDMRKRPPLWLVVPDFSMLELGVVAPAVWEDGRSALELPPELLEAEAMLP